MQNRIRCRIYIDQSMYDVTGDLLNWDEIYSKLKRIDYGGVMRSFAGKFEFTRAARDVIRNDFLKKGIGSAPKLIWEERNDEWVWEEVFNYVLDISSYSDDGGVLSISTIDDSVENIIKANKGTQYEYVVDVIRDVNSLYYDGLEIFNSVNYNVYDKDYDETHSKDPESDEVVINMNQSGYYILPLSPSESSEIYSRTSAEVLDNADSSNHGGIIRFTGTKNVRVSMKFHVRKNSSAAFAIRLVIIQGSTQTVVDKFYNGNGNEFDVDYSYDIPLFYLSSGYMLKIDFPGGGYKSWIAISKFDHFTVRYSSIGDPVNIDVISPTNLLNRLLQSMNGGNEGLLGEIDQDHSDRIKNCMILAAESIRGIPSAKLYTSFSKFAQWMSAVFGYVYEVDGNIIRFKHRSAFFCKEVSFDLGGNIREFNGDVMSSLIYSRVRAGYDKQEYDSINGRDEFRFTTEYSTGTTLTDNKLELISSYRADSYGIEFLVQKRGEDTTDKDSDNDVFFVGAKLDPAVKLFKLIRAGFEIQGVLSSKTMFNTMYSPRSLLLANNEFVGVSVSRLEYASSDGNSEVVIDGVSEKDAFVIEKNKALFMPFEVTIETNIQDFPSNRKGLVRVKNDGYVYSGFIEEAETFHGKSKSNGYKLLVNEIVEEK